MNKNVLIGIPVKNCGAWLENTVHQIINLNYYKENVSIVFIENDSDDYSMTVIEYCVNKLLSKYGYRSVKYEKKDIGFKLPHQSRHDFRHMVNRMNSLKIIRNHIVDNYLLDNDFIWWVDADYRLIPFNFLRDAVQLDVDFVMPRVEVDGKNYDGETCVFIDNKKVYINELAKLYNDDFYEMDLVECASLVSRKVFDFGLRYDSGYVIDKDGKEYFYQEGPFFSHKAKLAGFKLYASLKHVIVHQDIVGTISFDN